jgi:hypothetical protein
MDGPFSPVLSTGAPFDGMANFEAVSMLVARLRADFDLPTAEEEEEDDEDDEPCRPKSMSSLTSHLEMTRRARAAGKEDNREGDEDSTMVSNFEARVQRESSGRSSDRMNRTKTCADKGVSFGSVNVREYERIVGDNPCSAGVPIGLGWNYFHYLEVNVDIYESSVRKPASRTIKDFYLTPEDRVHILLDECGCSPQDITRAKGVAAEVRYQRQVSIVGVKHAQRQELCSPVSRGQLNDTSRSRGGIGSTNLPTLPKADTRWDTSCPAAPAMVWYSNSVVTSYF